MGAAENSCFRLSTEHWKCGLKNPNPGGRALITVQNFQGVSVRLDEEELLVSVSFLYQMSQSLLGGWVSQLVACLLVLMR